MTPLPGLSDQLAAAAADLELLAVLLADHPDGLREVRTLATLLASVEHTHRLAVATADQLRIEAIANGFD